MIGRISELITNKLIANDIISEGDFELYHYGLFIMMSDALLFIFTLILGIAFGIVLSSFVFFAIFFIIRRFAGGFHAKTELQCQIISLLCMVISLISIKYFFNIVDEKCLLIIQLICTLVLPIISPADTPQKPLSKSEKKKFKKIITFIDYGIFMINFIFIYYKVKIITSPIICAFVLETILVVLGKLFNQHLAEN